MDVKVYKGEGKVQRIIEIGRHKLVTDVPEALGGEDAGPEPHDLVAAALAGCTALTVTLYAQRKGWDAQDVQVRVEHELKDGVLNLTRHIHYVGELDQEQRDRLTEIANKCPVHKMLSAQIRIDTREE
ncbi:OsmC family protein [Eoetvoesiella caeni]|uniref:Putative OsmC-like protein n=1 Tax=Eoetvoesiella caeni TaxID=645616 RepID=A0A366H957_9BURK|nr:OsmC family protein [Eoetvoesiella caeni]MCI2809813.1 OsmC family protein [Eoetvoesiella caeni]NYT56272.1 OsmC family protein [Eoetvoesiella caeni]RBP38330.1 putative OsmC-like protein [Eoetvoesiella caeni]